jgi:hypothetical protein
MIVSETMGSATVVRTVSVALAETVPAKPAAVAVIVAVPADCPVTSPVVGFTDATVGVFEVQFTRVVTF